jgi:hypothetical protein
VTYGLMLAFLWKDLPEKYPVSYTLRIVLATAIAALTLRFAIQAATAVRPALMLHLTGKPLLAVSAVLFVILSALLLAIIRPLSKKDLDMIGEVRPGVTRYLKWFARPAA